MIPDHDIRIIAGLDLGRTRNYTALAVLKRRWHQASVQEIHRQRRTRLRRRTQISRHWP